MRVWLRAPVHERMGGEPLCPSTGTPWAASRTASTVTWWLLPGRVGAGRVIAPFTTILWRGCGCIRSSLAAVPTCSASRSVRRLPMADSIAPAVARRCSQHSRQGDSPSWRTTGSTLASPCLLSLRFCRQPERSAVLQRQQRVPHRLLQCDEPSLHRAHPRLLQEGTVRSAVSLG